MDEEQVFAYQAFLLQYEVSQSEKNWDFFFFWLMKNVNAWQTCHRQPNFKPNSLLFERKFHFFLREKRNFF